MLLASIRPKVMGILNVTPDSFYDGGQHAQPDQAVQYALQMIAEGVDIIDIGGESTQPNAAPVTTETELARVIPVISAIRQVSTVAISIDTSNPVVMREAVACGATMINDVRALQVPDALATAAALQVPVCLMHAPAPELHQVADSTTMTQIKTFLLDRVQHCLAAGIPAAALILDPGFGFGKTLADNLSLLKHLDQLTAMAYPILISVSRKGSFGKLLDRPPQERLYGSLAAMAVAVVKGAAILRTHDVRATVDLVKVIAAINEAA